MLCTKMLKHLLWTEWKESEQINSTEKEKNEELYSPKVWKLMQKYKLNVEGNVGGRVKRSRWKEMMPHIGEHEMSIYYISCIILYEA